MRPNRRCMHRQVGAAPPSHPAYSSIRRRSSGPRRSCSRATRSAPLSVPGAQLGSAPQRRAPRSAQPLDVVGGQHARRAPTSSGSPPRSLPSTGTPAASASSTAYGHGSSQREGTSTTAAPRAQVAPAPARASRPVKRTSAALGQPRSRCPSGPVAGDHQRHAGRVAGRDRGVEALLLHQPAGDERVAALLRSGLGGRTGAPGRSSAARQALARHAQLGAGARRWPRLTATSRSACSNSRGCWRCRPAA